MNNMNQFKQMFLAQLKLTLREKQAWFWGIFFPVILMSIFMVIFSGGSDNEFSADIAIVNENPNPVSEMLLEQIRYIPVLDIETDAPVSREEADQLVLDQDVHAAIILPDSENDTSILLVVNRENEGGVTTQALSGLLNQFVQEANLHAVGATPTYELQFESITSTTNDINYTDFLLTGMIALAIAQGGMFGMVDLVEMRRKGLIKRLRMTPANMGIFGFSDMTMRMIFSVIQIVLLSIIGVFVFGANLYISFPSLLVVFLLGALSFNALGYFFSSFSNTAEAYMGVANIASFVMMFLSGVFFPIETMPEWIQPISNVLPLTYFVEGLRESMVYSTGILSSTLWTGIGIVVLWGVGAYVLGSWLYKRKSIVSTR
ncbi:ABC transporter permease [Evansella cellulosilytica]|uniref:Transport permease protein n=1 Tax=Evansella cellulosilytica (strain ATCC 21833 / DSM 2522 / FERM P-1141 / JCM 9156 / N-4) TaxID=649639 RepID=E6TU14_EVAC2|nr:ABC transporter permease [Evansella cellulosilytica]ADU32045.1 ABC-2 type transporter [Evansella cellulosilytica DSM 2522]